MGYLVRVGFAFLFVFSGLSQAESFTKSERYLLSELTAKDLGEVHTFAKEILEQCKAPDCQIVSLGPTGALIDSLLRHYLGDEAIQYVPFQGIRESIRFPWVQKVVLPPEDSKAKKVLYVRVLESGVSIQVFAHQLNSALRASGRELDLAGYFMAKENYEDISNSLSGNGSWTIGDTFSWPYTIRKVSSSNIEGSYRDLDTDYYRYKLSYPQSLRRELWGAENPVPGIVRMRQKLARSLGLDSSKGKIFKLSEEEIKAWPYYLKESFGQGEDPLIRFGLFLDYGRDFKRSSFSIELDEVERRHVDARIEFTENPKYLDLDRIVKIYIKSPLKFRLMKCAARVL